MAELGAAEPGEAAEVDKGQIMHGSSVMLKF